MGEQSPRQIRSSCGDKNGVERSLGGEAERAVCGENLDVGRAKFAEKIAGTVSQGRVAFNGEYLGRQFGEQSGDVAGASSNFENLIGGRELERFEHAGNDVRLRDGLAVTDGQRMILVGLALVWCGNEKVAGDAKHGFENTRVRDAAGPELRVDHELARGGRVGHELRLWRFRFRSYCLRCRMRTSKLTTPFWSRLPTRETLRFT